MTVCRAPGGPPEQEPGDADIAAESSGSAIRELADRLVEEAAKASEFRVRLELSEKAQSTLEGQLTEERRRREEAERERDNLRGELEGLREARESPETVEEAPERAEGAPVRYGRGTGGCTGSSAAVLVEVLGVISAFGRFALSVCRNVPSCSLPQPPRGEPGTESDERPKARAHEGADFEPP
jgi:hypothetical protein